MIVLTGCTSVPTEDIRVNSHVYAQINFDDYKTYHWVGSAAILNDAYGQWEPPGFDADMEIKYLIDRELRKRGMSESSINPDLKVAFAAGIDLDVLELKEDPDTELETLVDQPQGGLAIVLVDVSSDVVIWLGTAAANAEKRPDKQTAKARLDCAVTQVFKKLPE
jgi:hypothetical protein